MTSDPHESPAAPDSTANEDRNKPRIKIGSQREGAPPPRIPPRVKTLFLTPDPESPSGTTPAQPPTESTKAEPTASGPPPEAATMASAGPPAESTATAELSAESQLAPTGEFQPKPAPLAPGKTPRKFVVPARTGEKIPPPNLRAELPPELAQELQEALGDMSVDDLLAAESRGAATAAGTELEPESRQHGKVVQVYR
ncbi:MAG TPA: hypothetical protein VG056_05220, partial [Pirellulales bacterium]|nr:hypothetical protein [Pirellulales bacterium]